MKQLIPSLLLFAAAALHAEIYYSHAEYRELYNEKYALELENKHLNQRFVEERLKLNSRIASLEADLATLRKEHRELQSLKNEADQKNAEEISNREFHIGRLTTELENLKKQKEEDERLCKSRLSDYENRLKILSEDSNTQIKTLEENHKKAQDSLLAEISALRSELEKTRREHEAAISSLQDKHAKIEQGLQSELNRLRTELSQCREEKAKTEEELKKLHAVTAEQQKKLDQLSDQAKNLEEKLSEEIRLGDIRLKKFRNKLIINVDNKILFASGSASLKDKKTEEILDRISSILAQYPQNDIQVIGHTDDVPISNAMFRDNWQLSSERALAVLARLLKNTSHDASRFMAVGAGQYQPVLPNSSATNRALNRRVDIVVIPRVEE